MTYRGHERDDEKGHRKEIWRHTETKEKQTELIWLPVPICKVLNTQENFFVTPLSLYQLFPNLSILRYTHHVAHFHLWSCFACWILLEALPGVPARQPERGEWDREGVSGSGTDLYSRSHKTLKAEIEEKSNQKPIKRTGREETACWFWPTWDITYTGAFAPAYAAT